LELTLGIAPFFLLGLSLAGVLAPSVAPVAAGSVVLQTFVYMVTVTYTYRRWLFESIVALPVALVFDIFLLHESMLRYEFFAVIWKGRNAGITAMRLIGHESEPTYDRWR
jgi:hypothetical protein